MKISMLAWNDDEYISLAEIILAIGWPLRKMIWHIRVEEASIEPGAEALENSCPSDSYSTLQLLRMITPNIQIIDGEIIGTAQDDTEDYIKIEAIDSTHWDIESNITELIESIKNIFPYATTISS